MRNLLLLAMFPLAASVAGCVDRDGPLERAGEEIDEAAEDIQVEGETTGNQIDDAIDEVQEAADDALD